MKVLKKLICIMLFIIMLMPQAVPVIAEEEVAEAEEMKYAESISALISLGFIKNAIEDIDENDDTFIRHEGYELYLIVPAKESYMVTVHACELMESEYEMYVQDTEELYWDSVGNPIVVRCNYSDLFGNCSITVETGVFPYPDGDQPAIRVRIGKAEGRNWWSLLYPEQAGMTDDVIYYSAVVDWLLRLFGLE